MKDTYLLKEGRVAGEHFIADKTFISITDIPEHEPVPRKRLREHLKSDDFFYVEEYPTAELTITSSETLDADSLNI